MHLSYPNFTDLKGPLSIWMLWTFFKHNSDGLRVQITPSHTQICAKVRGKRVAFTCCSIAPYPHWTMQQWDVKWHESTCGTVICYTCYLWPAHNSLLKGYSSLLLITLTCGMSLLHSVFYLHASMTFPVLKKYFDHMQNIKNITVSTRHFIPS